MILSEILLRLKDSLFFVDQTILILRIRLLP
jgi:hypothetical protein